MYVDAGELGHRLLASDLADVNRDDLDDVELIGDTESGVEQKKVAIPAWLNVCATSTVTLPMFFGKSVITVSSVSASAPVPATSWQNTVPPVSCAAPTTPLAVIT